MPRRRQDGRVQAPKIDAPPPIRPGPLKRDTFERANKPVVDTSGSQGLIQALGIAKQVVPGLINAAGKAHAAHLKDYREGVKAEFDHWSVTTSRPDQMQQIRDGTRWAGDDPIIAALRDTRYGELRAEHLARSLDAEVENQEVPFGTPQFNVNEWLLKRVKPEADALRGNKRSIHAFRKSFEAISRTIRGKHIKAVGVAQTKQLEDWGSHELEKAIKIGIDEGANANTLMDLLREHVYPDIGPRQKGGSLDLKYGRIDELKLDVIGRLVKDPKYAAVAKGLLTAPRYQIGVVDKNGKPIPLPPLAMSAKHKDTILGYMATADKTVGDQWVKDQQEAQLEADTKLLKQGRGFSFTDINKPNEAVKGQKSFTITGKSRMDQALAKADADFRKMEDPTDPNPDLVTSKSVEMYSQNGKVHPIAAKIDAAVIGALTIRNNDAAAGGAKDEPDSTKLAHISQAAQQYDMIVKGRPATEAWFDEKTNLLLGTYSELRRMHPDWPPEQVAAAARSIYHGEDNFPTGEAKKALRSVMQDSDGDTEVFLSDPKGVIPDAIRRQYAGTTVDKPTQLRLEKRALLIMRTNPKLTAQEAWDQVKEDIANNAMIVNGTLIYGEPSVTPADKPIFEAIINDFFQHHKKYLDDKYDIEDADELTVTILPKGNFKIVPRSGGHFVVPPQTPPNQHPLMSGEPIVPLGEAVVTLDAINKFRLADKAKKAKAAVAKQNSLWNKMLNLPGDAARGAGQTLRKRNPANDLLRSK